MSRLPAIAFLAASALWGQYKVETTSSSPQGLPAAIAGALSREGSKITGPDGKVFCEIWFRSAPPPAASGKEDTVTWTGVAHGSLIGVVHFPAKTSDRRGQPINPGIYTMRFSYFPVNGDHQGVAPQRDFLVLSKAADDTDPNATPKFDSLVEASRKVTGTPHPAVFSMWKADSDFKPGFTKMGENDWVLQVKVAGTPIAVILIGKAEG
ncbi:MAG TPA: hypothetical protein VM120_08130 [Bryobacteraceae bacterium]|nr:hypothetical protein [Bryobacteraceae bacterium]